MRKNITVIFIFILNLNTSLALDVNKGIGLSDEASEEQLFKTSIPYAIARQGQRSINTSSVQAYMDLGDSVYSLSSKLDLIQTNKSDRKLINSWFLTPYSGHLYLAGEYISAYKEKVAVHGEEADDISDSGAIVNREVKYNYNAYSGITNKAGCLRKTPLRYGDINDDDINELVLFIGTDIIVFSTTLNEVIFSAHYWLNDELSTKEEKQYFEGRIKNTDPQYIAFSGTDILINKIYPAKRSLSKLYFGQFNSDKQYDIIVWRKLYQSRFRNNPAAGFDKAGERLVHYSLIEGRYQREQTPDATIKTWLNDNNLTWSKGYPDISECPGEEGKLIPEMHDPLLNDPDVLK